jgi:endonuclease YncB( thermonuclease family)
MTHALLRSPALALVLTFFAAWPVQAQDAPQAHFARCESSPRQTCVVDGDTLWLDGAKIRLADINTPETSQPGCASERALGEQATRRLVELLNEGPFTLQRQGRDTDRYGRLLRVAMREGRSLGQVLVAEGLAEEWQGRRSDWCTGGLAAR